MRNQRGVAMLMAIIAMTILAILTAELVYQVGVYQRMVYNQVDDLRAQHLALSALRLAKLQLTAVQKGKTKLKNLGAKNLDSLINRIWQTPLILPPPTPKELGVSARDALKKFEQNLGLNGRLSVQIFGESDRINLNQLVWPPDIKKQQSGVQGGVAVGGDTSVSDEEKQKIIHERFKILIENIIDKKKQNDNIFRERYASLQVDDLLLNLEAWMSPKVAVANEENVYTSGVAEPYGIKNAPLQTMTELHMVKGFDDDLVTLFNEYFTTTLSDGVNINKASADLIHSLLPELDDRTLETIIKRRTDANLGGAFEDIDAFWKFLDTQGDYKDLKENAAERGVVLTTKETSYRVVVTSESSNARKTWVAIFGPTPPDLNSKTQPNTPNIDAPAANSSDASNDKNKNENDNEIPNILYLKTDG